MKNIHDGRKLHEYFKITQMQLAAYLVCKGSPLFEVQDDASQAKLFVFKKTPKLMDDRRDYFADEPAPVMSLFAALREVKGALYTAKDIDAEKSAGVGT